MSENNMIQEQYENFEGDIRKLEELIGQLELWSDEYTINHKKEEVRLPEYMELHHNLEDLKEQLFTFLKERRVIEGDTQYLLQAETTINERLASYQETEITIHEWVKEIKDIRILIAKSSVLQQYKVYLEEILKEG